MEKVWQLSFLVTNNCCEKCDNFIIAGQLIIKGYHHTWTVLLITFDSICMALYSSQCWSRSAWPSNAGKLIYRVDLAPMHLIHISYDDALWCCMTNLLLKCCLIQKGAATRCYETPDCSRSVPRIMLWMCLASQILEKTTPSEKYPDYINTN